MKTLRSVPSFFTCRLAAVLAASGLIACGGGDDGGDGPSGQGCLIDGDARFLPVVEGASWTYEAIELDSGIITRRTQTVGPFQMMVGDKAGVMASPLITEKETGTITNWQEDTGTAVVRHLQEDRAGDAHRDDLYVEFKGRLDESPERLVVGASYSQAYTARTVIIDTGEVIVEERIEDWEVVGLGEEVTVPAGTFCTLHITRQRTTDGELGDVKEYWFARGVGKVKELAENNRETLVDYSVPQ